MSWMALLLACGPRAPEPVVSSVPVEVAAPAEVRDALYFILVDRFADGTPDPAEAVDRADPQAWHGGDLQGVIDRLDHLEDLGVGGVWLSPISAARTDKIDEWGAFHGYWVSEIDEVEPRFGTLEQARELSDALRQRDMELWLDMVYNHVGYDTRLVTEHPDWFHHNGDVVDWSDPVQVVTHDVHGLPDLAQENEAVYAHLLEASRYWLREVGPKGFRVDAVRHLPPGFLARLGDELRSEFPDFEMLGEVFEGAVAPLAARQREDKLERVFDFPLHYAMKDVFCSDAHPGRLGSVLSQDGAYGTTRPQVTFLDNHDVSRVLSACGEDPDRVARALAFQLTARGIPSLTYGTEIGLAGAEEPDNRGDMVFGQPEAGPHALIRDLLTLRAQSPSVHGGTSEVTQLDSDVLVVRRSAMGEQVWVMVNRGDRPRTLDLPAGASAEVEHWFVSGREGLQSGTGMVPPGAVGLARVRSAELVVPEPAGARVRVDLVLESSDQSGREVRAVGAGEALGNWNPAAGARAQDGVISLAVPAGTVLAYKLVAVEASGEIRWESGDNRYLHAVTDTQVEVRLRP